MTACFFGDGAVAEGEFHESLNLAALWRLPVLFVCENNLYAMGTALERCRVRDRHPPQGAELRHPAEAVDGMDVVAVEAAARRAVAAIRADGKPYFLECRTYRFRAHSMFDAQLYRDKAEVEAWRQQGSDRRASTAGCEQTGLIAPRTIWPASRRRSQREIAAAVAFAEAGTLGAGRGTARASSMRTVPA